MFSLTYGYKNSSTTLVKQDNLNVKNTIISDEMRRRNAKLEFRKKVAARQKEIVLKKKGSKAKADVKVAKPKVAKPKVAKPKVAKAKAVAKIRGNYTLVVMPTYNRSQNIEQRIHMMLNQTDKQLDFLIIDDGSTLQHKTTFRQLIEQYKTHTNIIFMENDVNMHIAKTLNKGIDYLLNDSKYSCFTWISDDNDYYPEFIETLKQSCSYFSYSAFDRKNVSNGKVTKTTKQYGGFKDLLNGFHGCASFMWTRKAVQEIGLYTDNIRGCEDFEYLLRTFRRNESQCTYVTQSLMRYIIHENAGMQQNKEVIMALKQEIVEKFKSITITELDNQKKKISIVMAYYNRKPQTLETLKGFQRMYAGKYNFEVIIVDDNSNEENRLEEDIKQFTFPINLIVISAEEKGDRINPCIAYNRGFAEATGDIIVIQNPECYHVGDILKHTIENLNEQDYFTYSCFSPNTYENSDELLNSCNKYELVSNKDFLKRNKITKSIFNWYNHPDYNRRCFHWCSAIYKEKLDLIGGFDEEFSQGFCYDDDELLLSIKYNLKLNVKIINPSYCFVIHQHHGISVYNDKEYDIKMERNKILYHYIKSNHSKYKFNYPKLLFLYWDLSKLSYLHYLTIKSFNYHNPSWKIIIYIPNIITKEKSWDTDEQKDEYNGSCWFNKVKNISNVRIMEVNLSKIGFYNEASEVIKSDYFRYYILEKHGGIWSDFDILYTNSVEKQLPFDENNILFKCKSYKNPKNKESTYIEYYPVGFLVSKPKSKLFNFIKKKCLEKYDPTSYQSIGATMLRYIFHNYNNIDSIRMCNHELYLPWAWNELYEFYDEEYINNTLPQNNVGIHWFNGSNITKKFINLLDKRLIDFKKTCFLDTIIQKYVNNKILYITNKNEFDKGYGQYFRVHRLESLINDDRFDVFDINDNFLDKNFHDYSLVIITHDCLFLSLNKGDTIINFNNQKPIIEYFVAMFLKKFKNKDINLQITKKKLEQNINHWCSHLCCGHTPNEQKIDICENNLLKLMINKIKNRVIILEDMHEYTFLGGLDNLCNHLNKNFTGILHHYENNLELKQIRDMCPQIKYFNCVPHHINTNIFKNYLLEKEYDILLYGSTYHKIYSLRYKIMKALQKSNLNYKIIPQPSWDSLDNSNEELSREINKSFITIADGSIYEYSVCKYFEIAASNSVVAGDQPKPIDTIFENDMIVLNNNMSDEEIINILKNNLRDKKKLLEISRRMYDKIHNNFNLYEYNNKLYNVSLKI